MQYLISGPREYLYPNIDVEEKRRVIVKPRQMIEIRSPEIK